MSLDPQVESDRQNDFEYLMEAIENLEEKWGKEAVIGYLNSYVTNYLQLR